MEPIYSSLDGDHAIICRCNMCSKANKGMMLMLIISVVFAVIIASVSTLI